MIAWIQDLAIQAYRLAFPLNPQSNRPRPVRRTTSINRRGSFILEGLERREVLSTSTVTPFLTLNGSIPTTGMAASVDFHLTSSTLSKTKGGSTVLIGLDPEAASGSTLTPRVSNLVRSDGTTVSPADGSSGAPFIGVVAVRANGGSDYTATVRGPAGQSGAFTLNGFLAGDVNGDLKVDESDLNRIAVAYGSHRGDARYDAAADINQDGVVGCLDRTYAVENLGAKAVPIATTTSTSTTTPATLTAPVVAPQVTSDATPTVVPQAVAVAPVTVTVPTVVNPPVAQTPVPAVVPASQVAASSNVVWVPVVVKGDVSSSLESYLGDLTWSPQLSAYYSASNGTTTTPVAVATTATPVALTTTAPVAVAATATPVTLATTTAPVAVAATATPVTLATTTGTPVYYTTQASATPSGPIYFAVPSSTTTTPTTSATTQTGSTSTASSTSAAVSR